MNVSLARGRQPVPVSRLDQFDDLELVLRQVPAKSVLFVGGIDGDGADRGLRSGRFYYPASGGQSEQGNEDWEP